MTETYKFNNEQIELANRITALHSRCSRLEVCFEHNRKLNNNIVSAFQTGNMSYALKTAAEINEIND